MYRDVVVVNLDPANDVTPYPCTVDIRDLVTVEDVMDAYGLGPNGALMYCMEFLLANFDWLQERLSGFKSALLMAGASTVSATPTTVTPCHRPCRPLRAV